MKRDSIPSGLNLTIGVFLILVGCSIASDATISHFSLDTMTGTNVRIGGYLLLALGIYLFQDYLRSAAAHLKKYPLHSGAFIIYLCSVATKPFLQIYLNYRTSNLFNLPFMFLFFMYNQPYQTG